MRFDLTDQEWAVIEPLLPPTRQGGERSDDRRVISGIFYVLRTGMPWDDLPERYGPHTTVYNRFNRWSKQGIWQSIFEQLQARFPASAEMIDSTSVKAHRADAGVKAPREQTEIEPPEELIEALDCDPELADAFGALTPGRQRSYLINLASAKSPATRIARIAKFKPKILAGKGATER